MSAKYYIPPNEVNGYVISRSKGHSIAESLELRNKRYDIIPDVEADYDVDIIPFSEIYPIKVGDTYKFFTSTRKAIVDKDGDVFTNIKDLCRKYGAVLTRFTSNLKLGYNLQKCLDNSLYRPPKAMGEPKIAPNGREYKTLGGLLSAYGVPRNTFMRRFESGWTMSDSLVISTDKYVITYMGIRQPFVSKRTNKRMFYAKPIEGGEGFWIDSESYLNMSGLNKKALAYKSRLS